MGATINEINKTSIMLFLDIVIVHFNVFGPDMKDKILCNRNSTLTINKNRSRLGIVHLTIVVNVALYSASQDEVAIVG